MWGIRRRLRRRLLGLSKLQLGENLRGGFFAGFYEAKGTEAFPFDRYALLGYPFTNEPGSDRRQQDSAAKMAGCYQQAIDVRGSQNWQVIGRGGAQSGPGFFDSGLGKIWCEFECAGQYLVYPTSGYILVEADILDGRASQNSTIVSRHQVNLIGPQHALYFRLVSAQRNHLTFCRANGRIGIDSRYVCGERACGDDGPPGGDFLILQQ